MAKNMSKSDIRASLPGRMRFPVTIERLARDIGAPRHLVSEVVRAMASARKPQIRVVGTVSEDGERRVAFQEIPQ